MAKVLIVDDSGVMRKNIRTILERAGHEVVGEAADGREVLQNYIFHSPDIVTMDISMPHLDGIEALKGLLKVFPEAKVIMVSAIGQKAQVLEAIKCGAKSYMVKPIEGPALLAAIQKVL
ncbi:response regulator [Cohnella candidum]|uniref:Response regulator n=1 Tax=Cohnella candidum TaxID=2674991 RepID=A0A3G3JXY2_9BACL|nr:response regulator [Cohnella candidum]AYQ73118.1 response regulator [Cohnella candidum]